MAAIVYYLGVIFCLFVALKQAEAVKCYRCIYIEEEGAEPAEEAADEGGDNAEGGNEAAQAQKAEGAVTYGNADCKEAGDDFRIDYVTQDECTGELELAPVAAYKALSDVTKWNSLLGMEEGKSVNASKFTCQKTQFSMTSPDSEGKLNVWYRGCAYEAADGCSDLESFKEKDLFQSVYADIYQVKKETVELEGDFCACTADTCNGGNTSQISHFLVALCTLAIYTAIRK